MKMTAALAASRFLARRLGAPPARGRAWKRWRRLARPLARAAKPFARTVARTHDAGSVVALHMCWTIIHRAESAHARCATARPGRPMQPRTRAAPVGSSRDLTQAAVSIRNRWCLASPIPGERSAAGGARPRIGPSVARVAALRPHCDAAAESQRNVPIRLADARRANAASGDIRVAAMERGLMAHPRGAAPSPSLRWPAGGSIGNPKRIVRRPRAITTNAAGGSQTRATARASELIWRKPKLLETHDIGARELPEPRDALTVDAAQRTGSVQADRVITAATAATAAAGGAALNSAYAERIAEDVIRRVERRIRIERERRGH
ncbi:hypothetical protein BTHE68_72140 (plasmid) [Burkholderia sp. THE68]|uniref:hypothetical protein n=1 Tax=Burkholderia sp. THE68 TaxID=758782 RepID=UPI0013167A7D|nr:hypothetical protein [Burkholderia sp. THE68]BBU33480.1 hypothetical protein BTHE68_72140 [Burkholderia sp. THE68]